MRFSRLSTGLVVTAAAAALIAGCGGTSKPTTTTTAKSGKLLPGVAVAATQSQLVYYEGTVKHPVYWIGPFKGFTYELTETSNFDSYIRYLPAGVAVGIRLPKYTTVGTYPSANAYAAVKADIKKKGWISHAVSYKGIAAENDKHPTSVYLAYPKLPYLIEVYDPSPVNAWKIATSGEMEPVKVSQQPQTPPVVTAPKK
jgi:hypothetical protein